MNAGIKNIAQGQQRIHLLIKAPYVTGQGHKHRLSSVMNHERLYGCLFNALKHTQYEHAWVSVQIGYFPFLTNVSFLFLPFLPLFFSTEWSHLLLCGPFVPLVLFKDKMSHYFSLSRCPFLFVSALCIVSSHQKIILYQMLTCIIT